MQHISRLFNSITSIWRMLIFLMSFIILVLLLSGLFLVMLLAGILTYPMYYIKNGSSYR